MTYQVTNKTISQIEVGGVVIKPGATKPVPDSAKSEIDHFDNLGFISWFYEGTEDSTGDPRHPFVYVESTDSPETVRDKLSTLLPDNNGDKSAEGKGRIIMMPSARMLTLPVPFSTMQSIEGCGVGASNIVFTPPALIVPTDYAVLDLLDDSRSKDGLRGQGSIRNLSVQGSAETLRISHPGLIVHGYRGSLREKGITHRMENVTFLDLTGDGIQIGPGNDQFIGDRVRAEGVDGWAAVIEASDIKLENVGFQGKKGAMKVVGSAPEVVTFDFFIPTDAECEGTLHVENATRASFNGGTISGRTIIRGRNDATGTRYENTLHTFSNVNFKRDKDLANTRFYKAGPEKLYDYDSYILIEDAEGVRLTDCRFGFENSTPQADLPDVYMKFTTTTGLDERLGSVFLSGASGFFGRLGRNQAGFRSTLGFRVHYATHPDRVFFSDFVPGRPEVVHISQCDTAASPTGAKKFIRWNGTYQVADYQLGYLFATLYNATRGTLIDGVTQFTLTLPPGMTDPNAEWVYALRVLP